MNGIIVIICIYDIIITISQELSADIFLGPRTLGKHSCRGMESFSSSERSVHYKKAGKLQRVNTPSQQRAIFSPIHVVVEKRFSYVSLGGGGRANPIPKPYIPPTGIFQVSTH